MEVKCHITIDGNLKLGNFTLSFTDLEINTPGFPMTVSRTFDTLNADKLLDFGYGWKLDLGQPEFEVDYTDRRMTKFEGNYIPFRDGTRVLISLARTAPPTQLTQISDARRILIHEEVILVRRDGPRRRAVACRLYAHTLFGTSLPCRRGRAGNGGDHGRC